jgi:hypothetical protein
MNLASIDPGWVLLICGGLCCGGIILGVVLPVLSGAFDIIFGLVEIISDILTGGPVSWCGCIMFIVLLVACCGGLFAVASMLSTCGTADAVNFCRIFVQ